MTNKKIAVLIDSCAGVPLDTIEKYNMYVAPYKVIYKRSQYSDGVDITPQEVYDELKTEIPTTSFPSSGEIINILDNIKADGYEKVLAISISSGLSGVYNSMSLAAQNYKGLEICVLDTKNIAIGSGISAIQAAKYIEEGIGWENLIKKVSKNIENTKIFFFVDTLEYLQKGGRIGLVASVLGSALNLRPIISCNEDGIFYTVDKVIGKKRTIRKAIDVAVNFAKDSTKYNIAISHGAAKEKAEEIKKTLMSLLPNFNIYAGGQISPTLGVHTGPGAVGIAIQKL